MISALTSRPVVVRQPLRPCGHVGCNELVPNGRCAAHSRIEYRIGTSAQRGYDADHKRMRVQCFERDGFTCRSCGWKPQIVADFAAAGLGIPSTDMVLDVLRRAFHADQTHLHADHIIDIADRPDLRLVLTNYQTLCNVCHSQKTNRQRGRTPSPLPSAIWSTSNSGGTAISDDVPNGEGGSNL